MAKAIPEGFRTLTPQLVVRDAARAIDFYKKAFGAEELFRMTVPGGNMIGHAELKIGDSIFFLNDEAAGGACQSPEALGTATGGLHMYVEDVDASFVRAVQAGAQVRMPVADMFWGDRFGVVVDPFGHQWGLATRKEELTPQQMQERAREFYERMGAAGG
jgi:PhnB protein